MTLDCSKIELDIYTSAFPKDSTNTTVLHKRRPLDLILGSKLFFTGYYPNVIIIELGNLIFRGFIDSVVLLIRSMVNNTNQKSTMSKDRYTKKGAKLQRRIRIWNLVHELAKITMLYSYPNSRPGRWLQKVREEVILRKLEICLPGETTDSIND